MILVTFGMKPDVVLRFLCAGLVYVLIQCECGQHKHRNFAKYHDRHSKKLSEIHYHRKNIFHHGDDGLLNVRNEKTTDHKVKKFEKTKHYHSSKRKFENPMKRTNGVRRNLKLKEDGDEIAEINNLIDRDDDVDQVALSDSANNFTHNSNGSVDKKLNQSKRNSSDYISSSISSSSDIPFERYLSSKRSGNDNNVTSMTDYNNVSSTENTGDIEKPLNDLVSLDTKSPDEKHFAHDDKIDEEPRNQSPDTLNEGVKLPSTIEMMPRFVAWLQKYKVTHPDSPILQDKHLKSKFKDWLEEKVFSGSYVSSERNGIERVFDDFLREDFLHDDQQSELLSAESSVKDEIADTNHSDGNMDVSNTASSSPADIMAYNVPYYIHSPSNVINYHAYRRQPTRHVYHIHHHTDHIYKYYHDNNNKSVNHYVESVHPCQNGGIKIPGHHTGFQCICKKNFLGRFCEDINYCSSCPCKNNGTCNLVSHQPRYQCTCAKPYYGKHCEKHNPCEPNICQNGGTCTHDEKGNTACICKKGFRGEQCKELDSCFPSPCRNGGSCNQLSKDNETFTCNCPIAFKGPVCQYPTFCPSNPCENGGTCRETNEDFECICKEGYIGKRCTDRPCTPNPCYYGATCVENGTDYRCLCSPWASGRNCSEISPCRLKPCRSEGQCVDASSGFRWSFKNMQFYCLCRPPYMGPHCTDIICNHCSPNAHCNNQSTCVCDDSYSGNGFECEPENPDPCKPNPCSNEGTCRKDKNGDYICECKQPYLPPHCEIGDPCTPDPCVNGKCIPHSDQTFKCKCMEGYRGQHCNITVPCIPNPCQHNGGCSFNETTGKSACKCNGEWMPPVCAECNCPESPDPQSRPGTHCHPETGACVCNNFNDRIWHYSIRNKTCYKYNSGGLLTTAMPNPCQNGGTYKRENDTSGSKCICSEWFYGCLCQYLKQCKPHNPCLNGGTCVEDLKGNFTCKCPPGTTGYKCDALPTTTPTPPHPCNPNPCLNGGTCTILENGYDCKCIPRFTGSNCFIDKCLDCDENAECEQGHCKCKPGYIGNGYECILDSKPKCGQCPVYSTCVPLTGYCGCQNGYTFSDKICIPLDSLDNEGNEEDHKVLTTTRPHTNLPKRTTSKPISPRTPSTTAIRTTISPTDGAMPQPTTSHPSTGRTPTTPHQSTNGEFTTTRRSSSTLLKSPTPTPASSVGPPGSMPDDDDGPPPPDPKSTLGDTKNQTNLVEEKDDDVNSFKPQEFKNKKSFSVL